MPVYTQVYTQPAGNDLIAIIIAWVAGAGDPDSLPSQQPEAALLGAPVHNVDITSFWDSNHFNYRGGQDPGTASAPIATPGLPSLQQIKWEDEEFVVDGPFREFRYWLRCKPRSFGGSVYSYAEDRNDGTTDDDSTYHFCIRVESPGGGSP